MKDHKRKNIVIDDIVQLSAIPTPIIKTKNGFKALCPFCGKSLAKVKADKSYDALKVLLVKYAEGFLKHHKKCFTPKVDFTMKHVVVRYSFDSIQETFKNLGIKLTSNEL